MSIEEGYRKAIEFLKGCLSKGEATNMWWV